MKKRISIFLCLLLLLSITGCKNKENDEGANGNVPTVSSEAAITGTQQPSDSQITLEPNQTASVETETGNKPSDGDEEVDNQVNASGQPTRQNETGKTAEEENEGNEGSTSKNNTYKPTSYEATWHLVKSFDATTGEEYNASESTQGIYAHLKNGQYKICNSDGSIEKGTYKKENGKTILTIKKDEKKVKYEMTHKDGIFTLSAMDSVSYWIFEGCRDSFDYVTGKDLFNGEWKKENDSSVKIVLENGKGTYIEKVKSKENKVKGTYKKSELGIVFTLENGKELDCRIQEHGKMKVIKEDKGVIFFSRTGNVK